MLLARNNYNWTDSKTNTVDVSRKAKPWLERYWWSIPIATVVVGAVGYGIFKARR